MNCFLFKLFLLRSKLTVPVAKKKQGKDKNLHDIGMLSYFVHMI
jgi:hypothetical protein